MLTLVVRHRQAPIGPPTYWQRLYHEWQPRSRLSPERIAERISSLSLCLQSLSQELSRQRNRVTGENGGCWEARFKSCLLADDAGLLAATITVTNQLDATLTLHPLQRGPLDAAPLPLAMLPNGDVIPADQGALLTPPETSHEELYASLLKQFEDSDLSSSAQCLTEKSRPR